MASLDDPAVEAAYQADRAEARTAEGAPTHAQGKAAQSDGPVRYTAPSLIFESDGRRLEAGGFQPVEAYDVLLANLDPTLERTPPPEDPLEALQALPYALVTYEVAAVMAGNNEAPDPEAAEAALIDRVADGSVIRQALGDDALWLPAPRTPGTEAIRVERRQIECRPVTAQRRSEQLAADRAEADAGALVAGRDPQARRRRARARARAARPAATAAARPRRPPAPAPRRRASARPRARASPR